MPQKAMKELGNILWQKEQTYREINGMHSVLPYIIDHVMENYTTYIWHLLIYVCLIYHFIENIRCRGYGTSLNHVTEK